MCTECTMAFFLSPLKSGIVALSLMIAIAALVMLRRLKTASTKQRLTLLYVHVFAFVFPFLFFIFFRGCQAYFSGCDKSRAIIALLCLTAVIATVIALGIAPVIFMKKQVRKSVVLQNHSWQGFVKLHSSQLGRQPRVHVLNTAVPVAFSFSLFTPRIFLSAGLFDILGRKELEAIVLHELAHIKAKSSFLRLSEHFARLFSPFSAIASFAGKSLVDDEEKSADIFAAGVQGTFRHLESAKRKIMAYNTEKGGK